jgi:hypothetical protein
VESLGKSACPHTLLILAARSPNDRLELLNGMLDRLSAATSTTMVSRLQLSPLQLEPITAFVADTLGCPPLKALALAVYIHKQTGGIPLFVQQLMNRLDREGLVQWRIEHTGKPNWHTLQQLSDKHPDHLRPRGASEAPLPLADALLWIEAMGFNCEWTYSVEQISGYFASFTPSSSGPSSKPAAGVIDLTSSTPSIHPASTGSSRASDPNTSSSQKAALRELDMIMFLQRHVLGLSDVSRRVLFCASVIGLEFTVEQLEPLIRPPMTRTQIVQALQQPIQEELIARTKRGITVAAAVAAVRAVDREDSEKEEKEHVRWAEIPASNPPSLSPQAALGEQNDIVTPMRTTAAAFSDGSRHTSHTPDAGVAARSGSGQLLEKSRKVEEPLVESKTKSTPAVATGNATPVVDDPSMIIDDFSHTLSHYQIRRRISTAPATGLTPSEDNNVEFSDEELGTFVYHFMHDKILESTYHLVPPDDRASLHRILAERTLSRHHAQVQEQLAAVLKEAAAPHYALPASVIATADTVAAAKAAAAAQEAASKAVAAAASVLGYDSTVDSTAKTTSPSTVTPTEPLSDADYYTIANHLLRCLHLLAADERHRRFFAGVLLVSTLRARASGSFTTALYFLKACMFLMRLDRNEPEQESSHTASRSKQHDSSFKERQLSILAKAANSLQRLHQQDEEERQAARSAQGAVASVDAASGGAGTAAPPKVLHSDVVQELSKLSEEESKDGDTTPSDPAIASRSTAWLLVNDHPLLFSACFYRGDLEFLCGHHNRSLQWYSLCLSRTRVLSQQVSLFGSMIRLKTTAGDYADAVILASQCLGLLGLDFGALKINKRQISITKADVSAQFSRLKQLLLKYQEQMLARDQANARATATTQVNNEEVSAGEASEMSQSSGDDSADDEIDGNIQNAPNHERNSCEHQLMKRTIASLQDRLLPCTDERHLMAGFLFNKPIFAAYCYHPQVVQYLSLLAVCHCLQFGLCGFDGFSFSMLGASFLATPVDHPSFVAGHCVEWADLALAICVKSQNQVDYCRSLYSNAVFVHSFRGYLERAVIELRQAMHIGSLVGDVLFTTQSSLAIVLLTQYTMPLARWEALLRQTQFENNKLLHDFTVAKYCSGIQLILPLLTRESTTSGSYEECKWSPSELTWMDEVKQESGRGGESLPLSLFAIFKAKVQFAFHHIGLAQQSLEHVRMDRVAALPEIVTYLMIDSLTRLHNIRVIVAGITQARAIDIAPSKAVAKELPTVAGASETAAKDKWHSRWSRPSEPSGSAVADEAVLSHEIALCHSEWQTVCTHFVRLAHLSTLNFRDFVTPHLLVKAEMAYTTLAAFDHGVMLDQTHGHLEPELLPPHRAPGTNKRRRKLNQALNKRVNSGWKMPLQPPWKVDKPSSKRRRKTSSDFDMSDPFLRDKLTARIGVIYSTASAHSMGGRTEAWKQDHMLDVEEFANDYMHGREREESLSHKSSSGDSNDSGSQSGQCKPGSHHSSSTAPTAHASLYTDPSKAQQQASHAAELRSNAFVQGLCCQLAGRFQFWAGRSMQATNHIIISLRSFARWGASAIVAAMKREFAEPLAEVALLFQGLLPSASSSVSSSSGSSSVRDNDSLRPADRTVPHHLNLRFPIGRSRVRTTAASAAAGRKTFLTTVNLSARAPQARELDFSSQTHVSSLDISSNPSYSIFGASSAQSRTNDGGAAGTSSVSQYGTTAANLETIQGDSWMEGGGVKSVAQPLRQLAGQSNCNHPFGGNNHGESISADSDHLSQEDHAHHSSAVEVDLQAIVESLQVISRELVLPKLLTKFVLLVLRKTGAEKVALLSPKTEKGVMDLDATMLNAANAAQSEHDVAANPSISASPSAPLDDFPDADRNVNEWRVDAAVHLDAKRVYLDPAFVVDRPTTDVTGDLIPTTTPTGARFSYSSSGSTSTNSSDNTNMSLDATNAGVPRIYSGYTWTAEGGSTSAEDFPHSIFNFVLVCQRSVLLGDASTDRTFSHDPCVQSKHLKSILCLPLLLRNKLVSVLYLEHSSMIDLFSQGVLLLCKLISQQAMISLETAKLYRALETKLRQLKLANEAAQEANKAKSLFLANMSAVEPAHIMLRGHAGSYDPAC